MTRGRWDVDVAIPMSLRARILRVLEQHSARCCDSTADREALADALATELKQNDQARAMPVAIEATAPAGVRDSER